MGRDPADSSELAARAVDLLADVGPDLCCEGTQFLDTFPAGCDRVEGRCRQRTLTAVVEVGLVGQGRAEVSHDWRCDPVPMIACLTGLCVLPSAC